MINKFKIRCSAIGKIMGGYIGMSEAKLKRMCQLSTRRDEHAKGIEGVKPLTQNMKDDLYDLMLESKKPEELPQGAKTYCKEWLKKELYQVDKQFSSKYTDKGNQMEEESIRMLSDHFGERFWKNEEPFSNEYIQGTPDIITNQAIWDVKNSWDYSTFPLWDEVIPNKDYEYQIQGYMDICERTQGAVHYTLNNTPPELDDRPLDYTGLGAKLRIKSFYFTIDQHMLKDIYKRVRMCREYIDTLVNNDLIDAMRKEEANEF